MGGTLKSIKIESLEIIAIKELVAKKSVLYGHTTIRRRKFSYKSNFIVQRSTFES